MVRVSLVTWCLQFCMKGRACSPAHWGNPETLYKAALVSSQWSQRHIDGTTTGFGFSFGFVFWQNF